MMSPFMLKQCHVPDLSRHHCLFCRYLTKLQVPGFFSSSDTKSVKGEKKNIFFHQISKKKKNLLHLLLLLSHLGKIFLLFFFLKYYTQKFFLNHKTFKGREGVLAKQWIKKQSGQKQNYREE